MITIVIPIEPRTKKNHQQIIRNKSTGALMVIPSKQYKEYEKDCMEHIPTEYKKRIDYPVTVSCKFYMGTKRKCDLVNLLQSIDDILVRAGVLADDNFTVIESHDGSRVLYDKECPRTVIEIKRTKK
jgi:Holliday junction resolvase RusA-like endonuclease